MIGHRYPESVRERCVQLFTVGLTDEEVHQLTKVSGRTLRRWRSHMDKFGSTHSELPRGGQSKLRKYMEDALFDYLLETPDAYFDEMRWFLFDEFDVAVSERTLRRLFERRRWSKKKMIQVAKQQNQALRAEWMARIAEYTKEQVVCVDESACNSRTMDRKFGWSPVGEPCVGVQALRREKRWSLLPAYTVNGYLPDALIVQGSVTGQMFQDWIESSVLPYCQPFPGPRSVIVLDNASAHRNPRVRELIESVGCRVEYLPPYSPDFNPIERSFHDLKAYVKRHRREHELFDNFGLFMVYCLQKLTLFSASAEGHFRRSFIS